MTGTAQQIIAWLKPYADDFKKKFDISEHKEKRSLNANNYFHMLCGKIANAMTLTHVEVHNQMLADYGVIDDDIKTIILRDDIDWKKLDNIHLRPTTATRVLDDKKMYRVYHVLRGSHTYDSKEMSVLIDGVVQEAQALDIETITTTEKDKMLMEWAKSYEKKRTKHNTTA